MATGAAEGPIHFAFRAKHGSVPLPFFHRKWREAQGTRARRGGPLRRRDRHVVLLCRRDIIKIKYARARLFRAERSVV